MCNPADNMATSSLQYENGQILHITKAKWCSLNCDILCVFSEGDVP